jgi:rSAM/selenodomain-associated transferase 2/rSAM/selenodomain-associated transferase 1
MHAVSLSGDVELEVRATGASPSRVRAWLGRDVPVRDQGDGDLGVRLDRAVSRALAQGAPAAVAVGSDAPDVGGALVREALGALARADVVLGPATDGGYYLVGVGKRSGPEAARALFGGAIPWGSERVLEETLAAARRADLEVHLLQEAADIDREEDLEIWDRVLGQQRQVASEPAVSALVAALDEEAGIADAVGSARRAGVREVIVADGGSTDATRQRAEEAGALVIESPLGRARQFNAAAARATGDVLLLLHADSRVPATALDEIRDALADPDVVMGGFEFSTGDPSRTRDRFMSWVGRSRHRIFGLPYGDQGQFVRRIDFEDLGGMPEMPTMEDYEFALRCRALGKLVVAPSALWTSARAWDEHGVLKVAAVNSAVIVGYHLGASPQTLAGWRGAIGGAREPR